MNLDFLYRLQEHIESLSLPLPSYIGNLEYNGSVAIQAVPGGIKTLFYDGTRDQTYNLQITAKSKDQEECLTVLDTILTSLVTLTVLPSNNDSYQFLEVNIESPPTIVGQDEQGYFVYQLTALSRMFIRKGAI